MSPFTTYYDYYVETFFTEGRILDCKNGYEMHYNNGSGQDNMSKESMIEFILSTIISGAGLPRRQDIAPQYSA